MHSLRDIVDAYSVRNPDPNYKNNIRWLARKLKALYGKLSVEHKFYCYAYLDPRRPGPYVYTLPSGKKVRFSHRPFYIGKGTGSRWSRHFDGLVKARAAKSHKLSLLRKLARLGLSPIVVKTNCAAEAVALAFEIDLILGIGRKADGGPLTNVATGGIGSTGAKHRNAVSPMLGRKHSVATRERMRRAHLGKTMVYKQPHPLYGKGNGHKWTPEMRQAMSARLKGQPWSKEYRLRYESRPDVVARRLARERAEEVRRQKKQERDRKRKEQDQKRKARERIRKQKAAKRQALSPEDKILLARRRRANLRRDYYKSVKATQAGYLL